MHDGSRPFEGTDSAAGAHLKRNTGGARRRKRAESARFRSPRQLGAGCMRQVRARESGGVVHATTAPTDSPPHYAGVELRGRELQPKQSPEADRRVRLDRRLHLSNDGCNGRPPACDARRAPQPVIRLTPHPAHRRWPCPSPPLPPVLRSFASTMDACSGLAGHAQLPAIRQVRMALAPRRPPRRVLCTRQPSPPSSELLY